MTSEPHSMARGERGLYIPRPRAKWKLPSTLFTTNRPIAEHAILPGTSTDGDDVFFNRPSIKSSSSAYPSLPSVLLPRDDALVADGWDDEVGGAAYTWPVFVANVPPPTANCSPPIIDGRHHSKDWIMHEYLGRGKTTDDAYRNDPPHQS